MTSERREVVLWFAVAALSLLLARTAYLYHDLNNLFWQQSVTLTNCISDLRRR